MKLSLPFLAFVFLNTAWLAASSVAASDEVSGSADDVTGTSGGGAVDAEPSPGGTPTVSGLDAAVPVKGPDGFLNMAWGCSVADAKTAMGKQDGVKLLSETATRLVYAGGNYSGVAAQAWELDFGTGGFFRAAVSFQLPEADPGGNWVGSDLVDAVRKPLTQQYGAESSRVHTGEHLTWKWKFRDDPKSNDDTTSIELYDGWTALLVKLTYTNLSTNSSADADSKSGK